jgi:hypothetical protein
MRSKDHWIAFLQIALKSALPGTLLSFFALNGGASALVGLVPAMIGWSIFGVRAWLLNREGIEIKGQDVVEYKGFMPSEKHTALNAIESVAVQKSVFGQLLGYNTILLKPIGQDATAHHHVANASDIVTAIEIARRPVISSARTQPNGQPSFDVPTMAWSEIQSILTICQGIGAEFDLPFAALKREYLPLARKKRLGLVVMNIENGISSGNAASDFDLEPRPIAGAGDFQPFNLDIADFHKSITLNMAEVAAGPIAREDRFNLVEVLLNKTSRQTERAGFSAMIERAGPASLGLVLRDLTIKNIALLLPIPADMLNGGYQVLIDRYGPLPLDSLDRLCSDRAALARFREAMGEDGNCLLGLLGVMRAANLEPRFANAIRGDLGWKGRVRS